MANWRDLAAKADDSHLAATRCGEPSPLAGPFAAEVSQLQTLPPPRQFSDRETWFEVIADAERLVRSGWAERALALGWSAYDLFGIGPTAALNLKGWRSG